MNDIDTTTDIVECATCYAPLTAEDVAIHVHCEELFTIACGALPNDEHDTDCPRYAS